MTTDTTTHTPSESCLCDACPWAKREQAKQAERQQAASRRQAIVHEILAALRDPEAPACMRLSSIDVEDSAVRLDVTTGGGPTGRKVFTITPDASADRWDVRWRDEPATFVSGSLGYVMGGTPRGCASALLGKIADFVTPRPSQPLGRRFA